MKKVRRKQDMSDFDGGDGAGGGDDDRPRRPNAFQRTADDRKGAPQPPGMLMLMTHPQYPLYALIATNCTGWGSPASAKAPSAQW